MMEIRYKIGYIDENDSQVKTCTRKLRDYGFDVIGYNFTQGMTAEELMQQVYSSAIDLLIIDYKLNESNIVTFNGEVIESIFYETKPMFPHIIFTNKVDQAEPFVEDWKIIFDKESVFSDEDSIKHFVEMLERSIKQYQKFVNHKKDIIAELMLKEKLTPIEKSLLLDTQIELQNLDKSSEKEVPSQLLMSTTPDDIAALKAEADAFLQDLIDQKKKNDGKR